MEKNENWLFVTPIEGLVLTDSINNEIKIRRVTFVSRRKLPSIRKRLGMPTTFAGLTDLIDEKEWKYLKEFLKESETYAVLPFKGIPEHKKQENSKVVKDELDILLLSNLYYGVRRYNNKVRIKETDAHHYHRGLNICKSYPKFILGWDEISYMDRKLDIKWLKFQKNSFFFKYIRLIQSHKSSWTNILVQSGILAGKSQNENDHANSLLYNIIALEMLLTHPMDKVSVKLPQRVGFFLDWIDEWHSSKFLDEIRKIYGKRCAFVHSGEIEDITEKDVFFSDSILFNVFNNIVRNIEYFPSKEVLIDQSEKYEYEKKLGISSKKYQLGTFQYHRTRKKNMDIEDLLKTLHNKI